MSPRQLHSTTTLTPEDDGFHSLFRPGVFLFNRMLNFCCEVSRFKMLNAVRSKLTRISEPVPWRTRLASLLKVTGSVQCKLFSTVQ